MNICIFASGAGTNFEAILDSIYKGKLSSKVKLLFTNKSDCGAVDIAKKNSIDYKYINRKDFPLLTSTEFSGIYLSVLKKYEIDFIVLCGYMQIIPDEIIAEYKNKIINIHPSLLPEFGGKGMYGMNVHKAVIASGAMVSGITIHFVSENIDEGEIIFQEKCDVGEDDDEFSLREKVRELEHKYYSEVIKRFE